MDKIQEQCKLLLLRFPVLRNPLYKKQRIWVYWREFEGIHIGITQRQFIDLTDSETISRAFRKIQADNENLRGNIKDQISNAERVENHRLAYKKIN